MIFREWVQESSSCSRHYLHHHVEFASLSMVALGVVYELFQISLAQAKKVKGLYEPFRW